MDIIIRTTHEATVALRGDTAIALDIETNGLSPYDNDIMVISMHGLESGATAVLHFPSGAMWPSQLLKDPTKTWVTHNGTIFDLQFFRYRGYRFVKHYDTLIGEAVLNTQDRRDVKKSLGATMVRRTGQNLKKSIDHSVWSKPFLQEDELEYAVHDVLHLHDIRNEQERLASERGLAEALRREQELSLISMEVMFNGMALPHKVYSGIRQEYLDKAAEAKARLDDAFGDKFNVNSSKQVKEGLSKMGIEVETTNVVQLNELIHAYEIIGDIVTARKSRKKSGMYDENWYDNFTSKERLHVKYWQMGTDTTRYSSSGPNLQQIPREMRHMIGNEPGKKVVWVDYAQLEGRIVADITKDTELVKALDEQDFHTSMASVIFRTPYDQVDKLTRDRGKKFSFTFLFGGGAHSMVASARTDGQELTRHEAFKILHGLRDRFIKVAAWHNKEAQRINAGAPVLKVQLPWGHQRQILRAHQSPARLVNTKVQGTAAVGFKEALFEIDKRGLTKYIGGLIHDEIMATSVPDNEANDYGHELAEAMQVGMQQVMQFMKTPVDIAIGDKWGN